MKDTLNVFFLYITIISMQQYMNNLIRLPVIAWLNYKLETQQEILISVRFLVAVMTQ